MKNPWKSPGWNHTAPNCLADQKHCALSTQPNPYLLLFCVYHLHINKKRLHWRSDCTTTKASGSDGISGLLLKRCATVLAPSLTRIFNTSIVTGTVPHLFKKATITPIHKSGDKSQAGNYRPISLLPIVSKILEKVVSTQFKEYLNEHNFLPSEQFAYRQGHSAEDAVTLVVNNVLLTRDANLCTAASAAR